MMRFLALVAALALTLVAPAARAEEPPHTTFSPVPPGTVVTNSLVYLSGEAMHSQWRAVISKKLLAKTSITSFYQWYLSIYRLSDATYKLMYQSPTNGGPLDKVAKATGADMYFPMQSAEIVGAGEFMESGVQQLAMTFQEAGADCGSVTMVLFRYNPKTDKVVPAASVQNGCDLKTKIVTPASGNAYLLLTGPYYNSTAPMCCPTKNKASATLKYANGKWVESPKYFTLYPNAFPHP